MPAVRYDYSMTKDYSFFFVLTAIALGAACGAILRYILSEWLNPKLSFLPAGTLVCNLTGAFLIGIITAYLYTKTGITPYAKLFLVTGFLGSLTTFSTFSLESVNLFLQSGIQEGGMWTLLRPFCHIMLHLGGSITLAFAGLLLGKKLF